MTGIMPCPQDPEALGGELGHADLAYEPSAVDSNGKSLHPAVTVGQDESFSGGGTGATIAAAAEGCPHGGESVGHVDTVHELSEVTINSRGDSSLQVPALRDQEEQGSDSTSHGAAHTRLEDVTRGYNGVHQSFHDSLCQGSRVDAVLTSMPTSTKTALPATLPGSLRDSPSLGKELAQTSGSDDITGETAAGAVGAAAAPEHRAVTIMPGPLPGYVGPLVDPEPSREDGLWHTSGFRSSGLVMEVEADPAVAVGISAPKAPAQVIPREQPIVSPSCAGNLDEQVEVHKMSLSDGFIAEKQKDPSFTLLHYIAMLGHGTLAEALKVSTPEVQQHFTRMARYLIGEGADVFVTDKYGCTPLQLAAACGNKDMVAALLEPYGAPKQSSLYMDTSGAYADFVKYINHQDLQIRFSALHGAVSHGEAEVVTMLLRNGANPQVLDLNSKTAFQVAPSLASLQELLRLLQGKEGVKMDVIVQLMAELLHQQEVSAGRSAAAAGMQASPTSLQTAATVRSSQQTAAAATAAATSGGGATGGAAASGVSAHGAVGEPGGGDGKALKWDDVGTTIWRFFSKLYIAGSYSVMCGYLEVAVRNNHYRLAEMMIVLLCDFCPEVLRTPYLQRCLEPLVSSFPSLFHRLLSKLQDMRDEDVEGFVTHLRPGGFSSGRLQEGQAPPPSAAVVAQGSPAYPTSELPARPKSVDALRSAIGRPRTSAADHVKLLVYQQLVEGLKRVSYRIVKIFIEQLDVQLLNDMAQFSVFADFVGLLEGRQTAEVFDESDCSRRLLTQLLRQRSGAVTRRVGLAVQTLNVERVLWAAVRGGKPSNVEMAVKSIVEFVNINSRDNKLIFLAGITSESINDLARNFPRSCAMLLNLALLPPAPGPVHPTPTAAVCATPRGPRPPVTTLQGAADKTARNPPPPTCRAE